MATSPTRPARPEALLSKARAMARRLRIEAADPRRGDRAREAIRLRLELAGRRILRLSDLARRCHRSPERPSPR